MTSLIHWLKAGKWTPLSATDPIPVSVADANFTVDHIDVDVPPRTPATTSVSSSATSVTILAANANRRGVSIANLSTQYLYLSFSTPATTANSFMRLDPGMFVLLDQQLIVTGAIYGIWAAANGTAQVTEYV